MGQTNGYSGKRRQPSCTESVVEQEASEAHEESALYSRDDQRRQRVEQLHSVQPAWDVEHVPSSRTDYRSVLL